MAWCGAVLPLLLIAASSVRGGERDGWEGTCHRPPLAYLLSREKALQALGQKASIGTPKAHLPAPKSASWALEPSLGTGFKSPFSRQENQGSVGDARSAGWSPGPRRVSVKQGWARGVCPGARPHLASAPASQKALEAR